MLRQLEGRLITRWKKRMYYIHIYRHTDISPIYTNYSPGGQLLSGWYTISYRCGHIWCINHIVIYGMQCENQYMYTHIDGLVQDCSNSSALAMELLQSCTKPSIYTSGLAVSQNIHLPDFQNLLFSIPDHIWFRRKICPNLFARRTVLLAPGRRAVGYVEPCTYISISIYDNIKQNNLLFMHLIKQHDLLCWPWVLTVPMPLSPCLINDNNSSVQATVWLSMTYNENLAWSSIISYLDNYISYLICCT